MTGVYTGRRLRGRGFVLTRKPEKCPARGGTVNVGTLSVKLILVCLDKTRPLSAANEVAPFLFR
jgi:hypothetical protein